MINHFLPSSILVTGGAGFIGTNFVKMWCKKHPEIKVIVYDLLTYAGNKDNILFELEHKNCHFVQGCISNKRLVQEVINKYSVNCIVNFAAESHVDRSIENASDFILTNVMGTHNLLEVAKQVWLDSAEYQNNHRFHHVSTDEVYGSLKLDEPAFTEKNQYQPNSPYSASKAASDHIVRSYHHTYGLNVTTSNCSNNYGPYHHPEKLIPLVITSILDNKKIPIYGKGDQVRDWLYVEDHCECIEKILFSDSSGEVFNIGGGKEISNLELVQHICSYINRQFVEQPSLVIKFPNARLAAVGQSEKLISFVADRLGHDFRYAINFSKAEEKLNYQPSFTFEDAIESTIQWFFENYDWCKRIEIER